MPVRLLPCHRKTLESKNCYIYSFCTPTNALQYIWLSSKMGLCGNDFIWMIIITTTILFFQITEIWTLSIAYNSKGAHHFGNWSISVLRWTCERHLLRPVHWIVLISSLVTDISAYLIKLSRCIITLSPEEGNRSIFQNFIFF